MSTDSTIKVFLTGAQIVRLLCNTVANVRTRMCGPVRERSKIAKRAGRLSRLAADASCAVERRRLKN
jgi:hypothetical protein